MYVDIMVSCKTPGEILGMLFAGRNSWAATSRPEGRGPRRFFDFSGRELTFFRNSLQGEGREWEKETQCGKGLGSWDT